MKLFFFCSVPDAYSFYRNVGIEFRRGKKGEGGEDFAAPEKDLGTRLSGVETSSLTQACTIEESVRS